MGAAVEKLSKTTSHELTVFAVFGPVADDTADCSGACGAMQLKFFRPGYDYGRYKFHQGVLSYMGAAVEKLAKNQQKFMVFTIFGLGYMPDYSAPCGLISMKV